MAAILFKLQFIKFRKEAAPLSAVGSVVCDIEDAMLWHDRWLLWKTAALWDHKICWSYLVLYIAS